MKRCIGHLRNYRRRAGLETVEYAIILGLIVSAAITAIAILGRWASGVFAAVTSILGGN